MGYYGVIYAEGAVSSSDGAWQLHGMLVAGDGVDFRGGMGVYYNDACVGQAVWWTSLR